ncbi:MAG: riboflavin synthase [Pirellulales bacterium]
MFTGLVEALTEILSITDEPAGKRFFVARPPAFDDLRIGDSIAISGCCLTVVEMDARSMVFQAGEETLSKTTLRGITGGSKVNCERAMKLGDRIGGHLVSGHVDGVGYVSSRVDNDEWSDIRFSAPAALMRQVVSKGSIAVDGTSLTVVDATDTEFSVALIPHTLQVTTLGSLRVGDRVNLETDMMAKYVERQMAAWKPT